MAPATTSRVLLAGLRPARRRAPPHLIYKRYCHRRRVTRYCRAGGRSKLTYTHAAVFRVMSSDAKEASDDRRKYEFRKVIEELRDFEGSGTQLVTIYIPEDRQVSDVVAHVTQEHSEASNIKSKQTRTAVQDALTSIKGPPPVLRHLPAGKRDGDLFRSDRRRRRPDRHGRERWSRRPSPSNRSGTTATPRSSPNRSNTCWRTPGCSGSSSWTAARPTSAG